MLMFAVTAVQLPTHLLTQMVGFIGRVVVWWWRGRVGCHDNLKAKLADRRTQVR